MAVYFHLSPDDPAAAQRQVLAYTHDDKFKPIPGYKVAVSHFHTHFYEQLRDAGTLDLQPPWLPAFRARGINIAMMSDFHADSHPSDPGPIRLAEMGSYFEACRRHSDRDFLLLPGEEANAHLGGHYTVVFPKPVYWTKVRAEGQALSEEHPQFGTVYHTGSAADMLEMLEREKASYGKRTREPRGRRSIPTRFATRPISTAIAIWASLSRISRSTCRSGAFVPSVVSIPSTTSTTGPVRNT